MPPIGSMEIPRLTLKDGSSMPMLGLGTGTAWYKTNPEDPFNTELVEILKKALSKGIIHLDTADCYGTEAEVGVAIRESGIPRENIFLTTKVLKGWRDVPAALDASLRKLDMDYVDLYLLHHPYEVGSTEGIQQAWKGLEAVKAQGKAKSIGVSNFQRSHLEAVFEICQDTPVINQLEYHPYLQRANNFIPWMREHGVEVSSFKTLAPLTVGKGGPLDGILPAIAKKHGSTETAVILSWAIGQNVIPITTTSNSSRLDEYVNALALKLSQEEQEEISSAGLQHHVRGWGKSYFKPDDRS